MNDIALHESMGESFVICLNWCVLREFEYLVQVDGLEFLVKGLEVFEV